jgi:transaldolase
MGPLLELAEHGQSYWLDNLSREMIENGDLARRVREEGLRGVTSNPSIFHKAISRGHAYDEQVEELAKDGLSAREIYEQLVITDIRSACDLLRPVHEDTDGIDGFVSLEVSPYLLHDAKGTIEEARRLFQQVDRPNVLIKIPGSVAGYEAIEETLSEGINVNITLLFSIRAYEAVAHAYLDAMERRFLRGEPLDRVASVASFFLSRIDVLVDALLGQRILVGGGDRSGPDPADLLGQAAVANAKLAYQSFKGIFAGERWERLAERGARVQRVLWASTSTKNPLYSDVRYIEPLIGPDTVNTLPEESLRAFAHHGMVRPGTVEEGLDQANKVMADLAEAGIDFEAVTWQLLNEGMTKFTRPYDALIRTLEEKRVKVVGPSAAGPIVQGVELEDTLKALDETRFGARLRAVDPTLWTSDPETAPAVRNRLGWMDAVSDLRESLQEMSATALHGGDVEELLTRARNQLTSCDGALPGKVNSGVLLGATLGTEARAGRNRVTILTHPSLAPFAQWLEQLLAENSGNNGWGLLPVVEEPLREPTLYEDDRVFVQLGLRDQEDPITGQLTEALSRAGRPVVRLTLGDVWDLGAEVVRWEVATATAGAILGMNPFDGFNLTKSKDRPAADRVQKKRRGRIRGQKKQ